MVYVVCSKAVESSVSSSMEERVYLLLGTFCAGKYYVVSRVPVALTSGGTTNDTGTKLEGMDSGWLEDQASQVQKLLIGGLTILGICLCAPTDSMKSRSGLIVQFLKSVELGTTGTGTGSGITQKTSKLPDRLVLHFCTKTIKFSCKSYDTNQSSHPAELKFQENILDSFCTLETSFMVDIPVFFTESVADKDQLQNHLMSVRASILSSIPVIDGTTVASDVTLDKLGLNSTTHVELFTDPQQNLPEVSRTVNKCAKLIGHIHGRAMVHNKEEVATAIMLLKSDLANNLNTRYQLLCDDLERQYQASDNPLLMKKVSKDTSKYCLLPKRVYFSWDSISLSDFIFQFEQPQDFEERCEAIFLKRSNWTITNAEEFPSKETFSTFHQIKTAKTKVPNDISTPSSNKPAVEPTITVPPSTKQNLPNFLGIGAALVVLVFALFMSSYS